LVQGRSQNQGNLQEEKMPNSVDNPTAGTRPKPVRPAVQEATQSHQDSHAGPPDAATADRVEISNAAKEQAQATAPERGAAQDTPSAEQETRADSSVNSATRAQAEQLREQQQLPSENQQPGNLVDVTG
jgi:hypothetical protein